MRYSLACLFFCLAQAGLSAGEFNYAFKAGDIYRFDYYKSVTVSQKDEYDKLEEHKSEFTGVLVFEVRTVTPAGASGTLRIDSPRLTLPPLRIFSAQADAPEMQPDKNRSIAHAIGGAIKAARWSVLFNRGGSVEIVGRTPVSTAEWFKETANTAGWRKKQIDTVAKIVEQDLGFKASGIDTDIFLKFGVPEKDATNMLHPFRALSGSKPGEKDKMQFAFARQYKEGAEVTYSVPNLESSKPVQIKPKSISTHEGNAVFDTKLSMLDTLNEDYTAVLDYVCGGQTLAQEVRVQYRLKRLAPAITKAEQPPLAP